MGSQAKRTTKDMFNGIPSWGDPFESLDPSQAARTMGARRLPLLHTLPVEVHYPNHEQKTHLVKTGELRQEIWP